jgi:transposase
MSRLKRSTSPAHEQRVHRLRRDPGTDRRDARELTAGVFHLLAIALDHQAGPAAFGGEHRRIATGAAGPELDEARVGDANLLKERPQDAVLLVLRVQPEAARHEALWIRQRRGIHVHAADDAVDAGLQAAQLAEDLLVLLDERVQIFFDAVNALLDRQLGGALTPLREARAKAVDHGGHYHFFRT